MPSWRLDLEYDGTSYRGWQIQHNAKTIQGELEKAVRALFESKFEVYGSGRTDAGVHAVRQVAHLRVQQLRTKVSSQQIHLGLNDQLPHNINILSVVPVPNNFHARHDAVARYYLYQISRRRTAFGKNHVWWVKDRLDVEAMATAAERIAGRHDFYSFTEIDKEKKVSTIVQVKDANVFTDGDLVCFRIGASHFLWKMVRRLVGMLVEVGRGNFSVDTFADLITSRSNVTAQFTAPPSGLFLEKVLFPGDVPPEEMRAVMPLPQWAGDLSGSRLGGKRAK